MEVTSEQVLAKYDCKAIEAFLQFCQKVAREKRQRQIASISLEIKSLDPLEALQSIYGLESTYFYFEHPEDHFAIAAGEVVLEGVFEGAERFNQVRDFANEVLENTILFRNTEGSEAMIPGPHFITSFTFNDKVKETHSNSNKGFPPGWIFLPAWQLVRSDSQSLLTLNAVIESETDLELVTQKIWSDYLKFNSFDSNIFSLEKEDKDQLVAFREYELEGNSLHAKAIKQAIECIEAGECEKIVIARTHDIENETSFYLLRTLNCLRQAYPLCRSCLITNHLGQSFICATPERLLKVENNRIVTEALAGSIARGVSESEDKILGKTLLESCKDLYEHQLVIESIVDSLVSLRIKPEFNSKPRLKKLANVQHLHTPIEAKLPQRIHILDVAAKLHPTPAVCGTPLEAARKAIAKIENFDRGLYAGVLGFFDYKGNGELVVGIRSALIDGYKARLYAGSGIVRGSRVEDERKETDMKFQAMLGNLR